MCLGPGYHSDELFGDTGRGKVGHCEIKPVITVSYIFYLVENY
jgi:hypothetical protein